ncbi:MAG: M20/M25/M40 family metallo-hydrolase [Litorilinea sp.]
MTTTATPNPNPERSLDALTLAQTLITMPSPSQVSNVAISEYVADLLAGLGFRVEKLTYTDPDGEAKMSVVARLGDLPGNGGGGFGLFSHSDTVPGGEGWEPFTPTIEGDRLIGRGSCDMKGPLAATIAAAATVDAQALTAPLYIVVTADEEVGYPGARQVCAESQILAEAWPAYSVVAEPTALEPVYAHKGGVHMEITAHGRAAHTSTDLGTSANFLIAPFLAEMATLAQEFKTDARHMNPEFSPPTNGFNMVLNDFGCRPNVTAARTVCTVSFRVMPNDHQDEIVETIRQRAEHHGFNFAWRMVDYFYSPTDTEIVQAAVAATGRDQAITVPFGTEASLYKDHTQCVILGPGHIAQAHTIGEYVLIPQLGEAVQIYRKLIHRFCLAGGQ